jgi:hypothetical protein
LLRKAKALTRSGLGKLQLWHLARHKPYQGVPFEDRTPGDLLDEFYTGVAAEADALTTRRSHLTGDELDRLNTLEEILESPEDKRVSLRGLTREQSEAVWATIHKTGDDLADYWEYRIARGLPADLDIKEVPPPDQWDSVATDLRQTRDKPKVNRA